MLVAPLVDGAFLLMAGDSAMLLAGDLDLRDLGDLAGRDSLLAGFSPLLTPDLRPYVFNSPCNYELVISKLVTARDDQILEYLTVVMRHLLDRINQSHLSAKLQLERNHYCYHLLQSHFCLLHFCHNYSLFPCSPFITKEKLSDILRLLCLGEKVISYCFLAL